MMVAMVMMVAVVMIVTVVNMMYVVVRVVVWRCRWQRRW